MCRFIVNILLVACSTLPSWGEFATLAIVDEIEWDKFNKTDIKLICDTVSNDTIWTLKMQGYVSDDYVFLIKTCDGKVLELKPYDRKSDHVTDSMGHSPVTGELIEYYHYECVLFYHITTTALDYISQHGISKIRCGRDSYFKEIIYKRNELGKEFAEAYKRILYELSPDYIPLKKPTIYDDF